MEELNIIVREEYKNKYIVKVENKRNKKKEYYYIQFKLEGGFIIWDGSKCSKIRSILLFWLDFLSKAKKNIIVPMLFFMVQLLPIIILYIIDKSTDVEISSIDYLGNIYTYIIVAGITIAYDEFRSEKKGSIVASITACMLGFFSVVFYCVITIFGAEKWFDYLEMKFLIDSAYVLTFGTAVLLLFKEIKKCIK